MGGGLIGAAVADVRVLSTAHDVADARLHRIVAALAAQGASVRVEALGDPASGPPTAVDVVARPRPSLVRRLLLALVAPWRGAERTLVVIDPETVLPAYVATRLRRRRLVVDLHEDYRSVSRDRPWARGPVGVAARLLVRLVLLAAGRADVTVVADEHVPPARARRRLVVRNLPTPAEIPDAGEPEAPPRALYIGDLRPTRGLWTMVDAVAATDDWHLDLIGELREVPLAELRAQLERLDIGHRVRLHGRLPLADAWQHVRGAAVGLALLADTPAYREAVPTKVYEYLLAGLPVLATPLPRVAELVRVSNGGVLAASPQEAATTLTRWRDDPAELADLRVNARAWAQRHLVGPSPFDELARAVLGRDQRDSEPST